MSILKKLTILLFIVNYSCHCIGQNMDLSGKWNVKLISSENSLGFFQAETKTQGVIKLPGSLAEHGFGLKTVESDYGILTPEYKFIGEAEYTKEINIPNEWKDKIVELHLERVLWQSKVFLNGEELSVADALGTPHIHNLGPIAPGKQTLSIKINNEMIHNIGDKGHAYGEYTQSIWNGIVGKIELRAKDPTFISKVKTFPNISKDLLELKLFVNSEKAGMGNFEIQIKEIGKNNPSIKISKKEKLTGGQQQINIPIEVNGRLKLWNEFDPTVYEVDIQLTAGKQKSNYVSEFGYLNIDHNGTHILINGEPIFLRGNLDCVHFPITGYPSTKIEDWVEIFKTYKSYGLNHARFHSWCPPEAAFKAANRVGIYLQAEASIWIDWWMSEDMIARGRPEMDTKGYPKGLGLDPERDEFVIAEMNRVVDEYGNNPSFTMFCIGNELGNSDFQVMKKWVSDLKLRDPRPLYAISTARTITEVDDYNATHYIQGKGRTRGLNGPGTDWDFEDVYSQMNIPIIAHEIGQWPVYPSWNEIKKYNGVLKPRNFKEFKAVAEKNGIAHQANDFKMASGALNQIMYKYEIESFLRTPSCAGIQLLSMQDYQGQGEALIGWLDAHWDSKGITTPEKFREHSDETVPLLRMKKFVWSNDEIFISKAQISHFGKNNIKNGKILVKISDDLGSQMFNEQWEVENIMRGNLTDVGEIKFDLAPIKKPKKLTVSLELIDTRFKNSWDIWVFPKTSPLQDEKDIIITEKLDEKVLRSLEEGQKVLLLASDLGEENNSIDLNFYPLYWSLTFFPGQGKTSIGMLIQDKHPALKYFPTSFHSDWQWEPIVTNSKGFILNNTPKDFKPIVQVVDDFHRNNKEGIIFEFAVGKGKLLVCGFDIQNKTGGNPASQYLRYSLIEYLKSDDFKPYLQVDNEFLKELFPRIPLAESSNAQLGNSNILLKVNAGGKIQSADASKPWSTEEDYIYIQEEKVSYKVEADGVWKDSAGSAWHGNEINIEIKVPDGIMGSFYVLFHDWNNQGREGMLTFEGRKVKLGKHSGIDGQWVEFHVMREDSNDGKINLNANTTKGGNLMISEIIMVINKD